MLAFGEVILFIVGKSTAGEHFVDNNFANVHAITSRTTFPCTSVSRKSRPA